MTLSQSQVPQDNAYFMHYGRPAIIGEHLIDAKTSISVLAREAGA